MKIITSIIYGKEKGEFQVLDRDTITGEISDTSCNHPNDHRRRGSQTIKENGRDWS